MSFFDFLEVFLGFKCERFNKCKFYKHNAFTCNKDAGLGCGASEIYEQS